jgi:hypothetical protein
MHHHDDKHAANPNDPAAEWMEPAGFGARLNSREQTIIAETAWHSTSLQLVSVERRYRSY